MGQGQCSFKKFDDLKRDKYLGLLRAGYRLGKAATAVGVSYDLVHQYKKANPEFLQQCIEAEEVACEKVEDALFNKAIEGNITACIYWLQNRAKSRWHDTRNPQTIITNNTNEDTQFKAILSRLKVNEENGSSEAASNLPALPRKTG